MNTYQIDMLFIYSFLDSSDFSVTNPPSMISFLDSSDVFPVISSEFFLVSSDGLTNPPSTDSDY
jgi:hypothetical protein